MVQDTVLQALVAIKFCKSEKDVIQASLKEPIQSRIPDGQLHVRRKIVDHHLTKFLGIRRAYSLALKNHNDDDLVKTIRSLNKHAQPLQDDLQRYIHRRGAMNRHSIEMLFDQSVSRRCGMARLKQATDPLPTSSDIALENTLRKAMQVTTLFTSMPLHLTDCETSTLGSSSAVLDDLPCLTRCSGKDKQSGNSIPTATAAMPQRILSAIPQAVNQTFKDIFWNSEDNYTTAIPEFIRFKSKRDKGKVHGRGKKIKKIKITAKTFQKTPLDWPIATVAYNHALDPWNLLEPKSGVTIGDDVPVFDAKKHANAAEPAIDNTRPSEDSGIRISDSSSEKNDASGCSAATSPSSRTSIQSASDIYKQEPQTVTEQHRLSSQCNDRGSADVPEDNSHVLSRKITFAEPAVPNTTCFRTVELSSLRTQGPVRTHDAYDPTSIIAGGTASQDNIQLRPESVSVNVSNVAGRTTLAPQSVTASEASTIVDQEPQYPAYRSPWIIGEEIRITLEQLAGCCCCCRRATSEQDDQQATRGHPLEIIRPPEPEVSSQVSTLRNSSSQDIVDQPTSALELAVQRDLLQDLQQEAPVETHDTEHASIQQATNSGPATSIQTDGSNECPGFPPDSEVSTLTFTVSEHEPLQQEANSDPAVEGPPDDSTEVANYPDLELLTIASGIIDQIDASSPSSQPPDTPFLPQVEFPASTAAAVTADIDPPSQESQSFVETSSPVQDSTHENAVSPMRQPEPVGEARTKRKRRTRPRMFRFTSMPWFKRTRSGALEPGSKKSCLKPTQGGCKHEDCGSRPCKYIGGTCVPAAIIAPVDVHDVEDQAPTSAAVSTGALTEPKHVRWHERTVSDGHSSRNLGPSSGRLGIPDIRRFFSPRRNVVEGFWQNSADDTQRDRVTDWVSDSEGTTTAEVAENNAGLGLVLSDREVGTSAAQGPRHDSAAENVLVKNESTQASTATVPTVESIQEGEVTGALFSDDSANALQDTLVLPQAQIPIKSVSPDRPATMPGWRSSSFVTAWLHNHRRKSL